MKIIFVLDDQSILVSSPEDLKLRQIEEGLAALLLPAGKNEEGEDLFRPLITYPVVLMVPPPKPQPVPVEDSVAVPTHPSVAKPELIKNKKPKPKPKPKLVENKKNNA